jgi:hypothetical protein
VRQSQGGMVAATDFVLVKEASLNRLASYFAEKCETLIQTVN